MVDRLFQFCNVISYYVCHWPYQSQFAKQLSEPYYVLCLWFAVRWLAMPLLLGFLCLLHRLIYGYWSIILKWIFYGYLILTWGIPYILLCICSSDNRVYGDPLISISKDLNDLKRMEFDNLKHPGYAWRYRAW